MSPKQITILGSTGTIGRHTLDVIAGHEDLYRVFALAANRDVDLLHRQCEQFRPDYAVLCDPRAAGELKSRLRAVGLGTEVLCGQEGLCEISSNDHCDYVMAAIVGAAGLEPTLAAVRSGKRVLLANKESLVMSGLLFMEAVKSANAELLPIDSEHSAIFQCIRPGTNADDIQRILLTGSGGPLLREPVEHLHKVTPEIACAHPTWKMGRKISVDSATMMNKGLELIEAHWLFNVEISQIEIVIHPESIVHSMVEYRDGSVMAQLGSPDMRTPIAHGLAWPGRMESGATSLDFTSIGSLHFEEPDLDRYPCLRLAAEAIRVGGVLPAELNAANEIAVQAFLDELILFTDIPLIIEDVLSRTENRVADTLQEILDVDQRAREIARSLVKTRAAQ